MISLPYPKALPLFFSRGRLLAVLALPLAVACSRSERAAVVLRSAPAVADSLAVEVVNDNYFDARVYAVYAGGAKHALVTIRSHTSEADLMIAWQPRRLAFEVFLVSGMRTYLSHEIEVSPGDYVQLRLPPDFDVSDSFRRISR